MGIQPHIEMPRPRAGLAFLASIIAPIPNLQFERETIQMSLSKRKKQPVKYLANTQVRAHLEAKGNSRGGPYPMEED